MVINKNLLILLGVASIFMMKNGLMKKGIRQVSKEAVRGGRKATDVVSNNKERMKFQVRTSARRRNNRTNLFSALPRLDKLEFS